MCRLLLTLAVSLIFTLPVAAGPKNVVLLTHGFASVSSCSPSRASLLTGMPTHMCGQHGLAHAEHDFYTFRKVKGLPALLSPAGYRSGVIAKTRKLDDMLVIFLSDNGIPFPRASASGR